MRRTVAAACLMTAVVVGCSSTDTPPVYALCSDGGLFDGSGDSTSVVPDAASDIATTDDGGETGGCTVTEPMLAAPSAVYVLMDDTQAMATHFGANGVSKGVALSFTDPVFSNTFMAFAFFDHAAGDCVATSNPYATPPPADPPSLDPFALVPFVQNHVATLVGDTTKLVAGTPPLYVDAALQSDGAYKALHDFASARKLAPNRLAVVLVVSRPPVADCAADAGGPPAPDVEAAAALAGPDHVYTYVVQLSDDLADAGPAQTAASAALAKAGGTTLFDATANPQEGAVALDAIAADLGACLYEAPVGITPQATVGYADPATRAEVDIAYDPTCAAATAATAKGWNTETSSVGTRVRVCGAPCSAFKTAIGNLAGAELAKGAPVSAVPVFAKVACP